MPTMFPRLNTLDQVNAQRRAVPKHELPSKLDRAKAKEKADRLDEAKLTAWATAVKERDEWKDRKDGRAVKKTRALHSRRAEAHHVVSRDDLSLRYDVRNGLCLAYETHEAVERNQLRIVGTKFFTLAGKRHIDCTHQVRFVKVKPIRNAPNE